MAGDDPYSKRDGETIRELPSGLEIVRRRKHEAIKLAGLSAESLRRLTNKTFGSKFIASWNVERVVAFVAERVLAEGWSSETGQISLVVEMNETVGYVNGRTVTAIKIVSDGRYIHAYPVEG